MRRAVAAVVVVAAVAVALVVARRRGAADSIARCGPGFDAQGPRCVAVTACPTPLVPVASGCDAPDVRVGVPGGAIALGASDWEAEGRVPSRAISVQPFRIDAFEVTRGAMGATTDVARAAANVTPREALEFCARRGGRLPTEDEWMAAAASVANPPRRYPWGDTGAVCRRAAWGLATGPCATGADGPDTVAAHPDGDSPLGLHDMAGNVAEWVTAPPEAGRAPTSIAKGGSWATTLAADLRIWARLELPEGARDPRVGFRCIYPP